VENENIGGWPSRPFCAGAGDGMPLVANMQFDVFVSYASVDDVAMDLPGRANPEGWVSRFVQHLKRHVIQRHGDRRFEVWFARQRLEPGRLDDFLKQNIAQSCFLLVTLSRGYLNSPHCLLEFDHFMAAHPLFKERIYVVDMQNVLEDASAKRDAQARAAAAGYEDVYLRVIAECQRQKRLEFFQFTGPGRADPLDELLGETSSLNLARKIADVAYSLSREIDKLNQGDRSPPATVSAPVAEPAPRVSVVVRTQAVPAEPARPLVTSSEKVGVMVALCKETLKPRREDVVRFLESRDDVFVLPEDPALLWPQAKSPEDFSTRVRETMGAADIFVQLIGAPRGAHLVSEDLPDDFVRLQLEAAETLEKKPIIWCTPNLMNSELTAVESDIRRKRSVIEDTIETLKRQIDTQVTRFLKEKAKPPKLPDDRSIFFTYVHAGRDLVRPIADSFRSACWDVFEPSQNPEVLEYTYRECDAAVIFAHHAPEPWMDAQMMEFIRAKRRPKPIRPLALVKPKSAPAPNIRPATLKIVEVPDDEGPADLERRLSALLVDAA
jgi:hypothetical protein